MRPILLVLLVTAACGGGGGSSDGSAELTFAVSQTVRQSPNLVDPLQGTIYGGVFFAVDVTSTGPVDGAEPLQYVTLPNVDLDAATQTTPIVVEDMPADDYVFLGFFDLDGNGASQQYPDAGDAVTLPGGGFAVESGAMAAVAVQFDLVLN
jgi:hypothetical protein